MIIVVLPLLFRKSTLALTIFPFVFVKHQSLKDNLILLNHEKIHLRQQIEMFWLFFFFWYGLEFLIRLIRVKNVATAYRNISFEREAYANESNLHYLRHRPLFCSLKYLSDNKR